MRAPDQVLRSHRGRCLELINYKTSRSASSLVSLPADWALKYHNRDKEDGFFLCMCPFVFRRKVEDSASLPESSTFQ